MTRVVESRLAEDSGQQVLTPGVKRVAKRSIFWLGVAAVAIIVGVVSLATAGSTGGGIRLSPSNAAPAGSMALAEVLRQQGVTVTETRSLAGSRSAISDADETTLVLYDHDLLLDEDQLREAVGLATHVVLVDPTFDELRAVAPGIALAGRVTTMMDADCSLPAAQRAGTVSGEASGYRVIDKELDATRCLGSGDGVYSLIQLHTATGTLTILGATGALSNGEILASGNAALALGLLGEHENLVWYIPSIDDVPQENAPTLADLTPPWVTPVLSLLLITFIVAAFWRGRRMGPLVVERLPVTVRASETMLGRARLYEKASARLRALDSLRIGTIDRLARICGLSRLATVDEVIASVSAISRTDPAIVRGLLLDTVPSSDADLVRLSDELLTLERATRAAVKPR